MAISFEALESQLSDTEMALLMAVNVAMNAAMLAGAKPQYLINSLDQHEKNFAALGRKRAEDVTGALKALVKNSAGQKWR